MAKDKRYNTAKILIETSTIKTFLEIFETILKTVVATDLHMNNNQMNKRLSNSEEFTIREIKNLAELLGVKEITLIELILAHISKGKGRRQ